MAHKAGSSWGCNRTRALLLLLLLGAGCTEGAAPRERRKLSPRSGPAVSSIAERGLDATSVAAADLAEGGREWHDAGAGRRAFGGPVLGYVTPWNRAGHEAAVRFRAKLTHVSPVWYQLRVDGEGALVLVGGHEFNATWIEELRAPPDAPAAAEAAGVPCGEEGGAGGGGEEVGQMCSAGAAAAAGGEAGGAAGGLPVPPPPPPKVVPRVIVELTPKELGLLLGRPGPAIDRLVTEVESRGYDGIVLEAWQQWAGGFGDDGFAGAALGFIRQLGANLREKGAALLLAVPPALPAGPGRPLADPGQLAAVADVVEGFSVMTYDYLATVPGHNGPLPWQRKNLELLLEGPEEGGGKKKGKGEGKGKKRLEPRQVLLGVNFYGYEFSRPDGAPESSPWSADAVTAERFLSVLGRVQPPLKWDAEAAEHYVKFKEGGRRRQIFFPTPASLAARAALAREWGAGLSVWELGQGMEAFFDVL